MVRDSSTVINWGLDKGIGSWKLPPLLYEIRELSSLLGLRSVFEYVPRDSNLLADMLANIGVGRVSCFVSSDLLKC